VTKERHAIVLLHVWAAWCFCALYYDICSDTKSHILFGVLRAYGQRELCMGTLNLFVLLPLATLTEYPETPAHLVHLLYLSESYIFFQFWLLLYGRLLLITTLIHTWMSPNNTTLKTFNYYFVYLFLYLLLLLGSTGKENKNVQICMWRPRKLMLFQCMKLSG
jgi:hypothetical protein